MEDVDGFDLLEEDYDVENDQSSESDVGFVIAPQEKVSVESPKKRQKIEEINSDEVEKAAGATHSSVTRHANLDPISVSLLKLANECFVKGDYDSAWKHCMEVTQRRSDVPDPYWTMFLIAEDRGDAQKAAQLFFEACRADPSVVPLNKWLEAAERMRECKLEAEEAECWRFAVAREPRNVALWRSKIKFSLSTGRNDVACVSDLKKVIELDPTDLESKIALSDLLLQLGMYKEGLVLCSNENFDKGQLGLRLAFTCARLLARLERYEDMLLAINDALQRNQVVDGADRQKLEQMKEIASMYKTKRIVQTRLANLSCVELVVECARLLNFAGMAEKALDMLKHVDRIEGLVLRLQCFESLNLVDEALAVAASILNQAKTFPEVRTCLVHACQNGHQSRAGPLLRELEDLDRAKVRAVSSFETRPRIGEGKSRKEESMSLNERKLLIGGWQHQYMPIKSPMLELSDRLPFTIYKKVMELYNNDYVQETITLTAPILAADRSRRERFGMKRIRNKYNNQDQAQQPKSSRKQSRRRKDVTHLVAELGELKFLELYQVVIRCLMRVGNIRDASRYIRELLQMYIADLASYQNLTYFAFAIGWPFEEVDLPLAMKTLRTLLLYSRTNHYFWNIFAKIASRSPDIYLTLSSLVKSIYAKATAPVNHVVYGHLLAVRGDHEGAKNQYEVAFRDSGETDPLSLLCLACSHFNLSRMSKTEDPNTQVLQGIGLVMRLFKSMSENSWGAFNVGRAFHEIGMLEEALQFYDLCIKLRVKERDEQSRDALCIEKDAAFNMHLIYLASGNEQAARQALSQIKF